MYLSRLIRKAALVFSVPRTVPWLPALAGAALLCSSCAVFAQASAGITGTVTDASGSVIPGASVSIVNGATQQTLNLVTTSAGTYTATGLLPGHYTVTVTAAGFSKTVKNDVNIEVSTQSTIDFTLNPGAADTTVEVTAPSIALNTSVPELGTTIEPEVVNSLPNEVTGGRGRQIDNFIFLAPGVQGDTFSHRINGGVDFQTETVFNGIPVPQAETAGYTTNFNPPYEMVNQFRVERSTFAAQYGLAQGAVTYQMASGTNSFHGDVFEINRNNFFDAKGYFNDVTPIDKENNYGFTVGGPVWIPHLYNGKDRTFFHFSLDFTKQSHSDTDIGTVPTALEKTGNFSDFVDASGNVIPIFDPTTGQQFPGNIIPQARFSPISASVLSSLPDPDRPGLQGNKTAAPNSIPNINHTWGFTVDHNLTSKQSIHYSEWRNTLQSAGFDNRPIVPIDNILQSEKTLPYVGSVFLLNYSNIVTPKLVATAGFSWIGEINNQFDAKRGVNFAGVVQNPLSDIFPNVQFDGSNAPTNWGTTGGWPQSINRKLGIAIVNNWLWSKGRNTFNIGGEFRRTYQDDNECQQCGGQVNFSQRTTADPNNISSTGSAFASYLLGQIDNVQRIFANELRLRNLSLSPYIQDDFKLTPKLTLNLGLRWDILRPFTEVHNQIVYFDPTRQNPAADNRPGAATKFGSCAACAGLDRASIHWKQFGPRLGIAYAVNNRTVVQAGYSLAFLDGGAYEYGTSKVAVSYGNLLQGAFTRNSTNSTTPGYGSWDGNPIPAPAPVAFNSALGTGTLIRAFDPKNDGRAPYVQQYNVNLQRELPWNVYVQAAYLGNRAVHLNGQLNPINQPNPSILQYGPLLSDNINDPAVIAAGFTAPYANFSNDFGSSATLVQALQTYPQYSNIYNNYDLTGAANYNALQVAVEKRYSNGLALLTSYTLSKSMSNVDSGFSTFASLPETKFNQKPEWTVGGNDIRNNVKISGTYDLPIGPGRTYLNNKGATGQILGGWQVGFILAYQSGTPFGITENGNPLGTPGGFNRPNRVPSVGLKMLGYHLNGRERVSTPAFTVTGFAPTTAFTLGDAVRNYAVLRNPAHYNENLNVRKHFALGERVQLILQMDYFNAFNRTILNGPADSGLGTNIDNSDYGLLIPGQHNSPRQGQVSGRITF